MDERIKAVAREDASRIKAVATQAITSRAWLYPFKGLAYFATHRDLWRPLVSRLMPTITTAVSVTTSMFLFTYLPQASILALFNGPFAFISTILLVLNESSTITNIVARNFFIQDALVDTFDGTLVGKGQSSIVAEGRQLTSGRDAIARLGKIIKSPFARFGPNAIIRYFLYLPLNFIPIFGTIIFLVLQGKRLGPLSHARYFQLRKMGATQREKFVDERRGAYTGFGLVATVLEMIPFVGIFFAFSNTTGAALWAADLEKERGNGASGQETEVEAKDD